ncbi:class I SAM-dependent methyltransferase [Natronococcus occultus]|uniref:Methylase involved in ubiquinone/menaquinone biosynthesis n=1 Tax=Natronococcus occultus SP4 TaxID=694430 RepID=L0JWF3_9EURY|nr:class I SAM-dependent methyltransferase [Natronococcus occultus]AGB37337.1 methylase involved in ubiquinone/menaquinone biosynthesis [Natronococcus occultus SP4]
MKKSPEEHAARFDEKATEYDESKSDEYRACANLVIEHAAPDAEDVVLDLGTGTGAIALALAPDADRVVGRDISEGMMDEARTKAQEDGLENVEFDRGTFREPEYDGPVDAETSETSRAHTRSPRVDVVTSNFAMHHLSDEEKREAIDVIAALEPDRFVLGDVMFFGEPDPEEPFYSPEVDDPATVGTLADAFTSAGFSLTAVERVHDQVGVLVAERGPATDGELETDG